GAPLSLSPVSVPPFPASPGCWYGCGSDSLYLGAPDLLPSGQAASIVGDPAAILDLDTLVTRALAAGESPLRLAASYLADGAASAVHGIPDRSAPRISNVFPAPGSFFPGSEAMVSAWVSDRTLADVTVNGVSAPFHLGTDGIVHLDPTQVPLVPGAND